MIDSLKAEFDEFNIGGGYNTTRRVEYFEGKGLSDILDINIGG